MTAWGLDRTRSGWVVAGLGGGGQSGLLGGRPGEGMILEVLRGASGLRPEPGEVVAVDIPLPPFPDGIGRRCESEARKMLGTRSASVFPTLPRWCYLAAYDEATRAEARRRYGKAYSKQAWNLREAVLDAEAAAGPGWVETHPELGFLVRNNGNDLRPKKTWDGVRDRLDVLDRAGVKVPTGGFTLPVPPHDVLDAVMCAVVARDVESGVARSLPADPRPGEARIWF